VKRLYPIFKKGEDLINLEKAMNLPKRRPTRLEAFASFSVPRDFPIKPSVLRLSLIL